VVGDEVGWTKGGEDLVGDLERFLDARIRSGSEADRIEARGRRVVLGLFAAYFADPGLLGDHVLFRMKELAGVRYFRDLPRGSREQEPGGIGWIRGSHAFSPTTWPR
jgi:dGTP triphosphohydrolase